MKFESFEKNREKIDNQYSKVIFEENSGQNAEQLFKEIEEIYYSFENLQIGKGKALKHFFENVKIHINPADIYADITENKNGFTFTNIRYNQTNKYKTYEKAVCDMIEGGAFFANEDFGHTMPDWKLLLDNGITGIITIAEEKLKSNNLTDSQKSFYLSVKYAYEGILAYTERLYKKCVETEGVNAAFAAENLKSLTLGAPKTFCEAAQLYFVFYNAQHTVEGENLRSLGALDELLYPYYKHDIENGVLTEEELREALKYFLFMWTSMNFGANIPFYIANNTNELTYVILEEYKKLDIMDPKLQIKCNESTTEKVYRIVLDYIRSGNNSFVFMNDKVIKKALINIGENPKDVENYAVIGCYEPCAAGKEIPCTCNIAINMPLAVEAVLCNGYKFDSGIKIGLETGELSSFRNFEDFINAVKAQLVYWCESSIKAVNKIEAFYPQINQAPILSATFKDAMEKGADVYNNGAKYNNSSVCTFGTATIADELLAIKKAVFDEKIITLSDLAEVLKNNWENNLPLRKKLRDGYPKYGNGNKEADSIAKEILNTVAKSVNKKPNGRGGVYRLGTFSIDWRIGFGNKTGASADGRFCGEPVSKNMCSSIGLDKNGITALINSVTELDYTNVPNGTVLDLSVHPSAAQGEEGMQMLLGLLKVYLNRGGFAIHINIVDADTLRKAQNEPEKYRNLQIRLCGWNVYFIDLSEEYQNDLIKSLENTQ